VPQGRRSKVRNIAYCVPRTCVGCEVDGAGVVKLLVPRFRARWMQWLQKRLRKPHIRVALDEIGSAVWQLIDGRRTVVEIGEELERRFGEKLHPTHERLGMYFGILRRNRFVEIDEPCASLEEVRVH
jgi:hypothetical protein